MSPLLLHALIYTGMGLLTLGAISSGRLLKDFSGESDIVPGIIFSVMLSIVWPGYWLFCFISFNRTKP